jgi:hypothetical protein
VEKVEMVLRKEDWLSSAALQQGLLTGTISAAELLLHRGLALLQYLPLQPDLLDQLLMKEEVEVEADFRSDIWNVFTTSQPVREADAREFILRTTQQKQDPYQLENKILYRLYVLMDHAEFRIATIS